MRKVWLAHGAPPLRPFPDAAKRWLMRTSPTTDFQYAMIAGLFAGQRCTPFAATHGSHCVYLAGVPTLLYAAAGCVIDSYRQGGLKHCLAANVPSGRPAVYMSSSARPALVRRR